MTAPISAARLAEIRHGHDYGINDTIELLLDCLGSGINALDHANKGRANWIRDLKQYQADHVGLLAYVDELSDERDEARATATTLYRAINEIVRDDPRFRTALGKLPDWLTENRNHT